MTDLNLNRERVTLLADINAGKVYVSLGGKLMRRVRGGQNRRVDAKVRELRAAELVDPELLELTDTGVRALEIAGGGR